MIRKINSKVDWLLWFLILLPTFYIYGKDTRFVQMNFFQLAVMAALAFFHSNKWLGAFLGWCLFQFIFFKVTFTNPLAINNLFLGILLYHFIVRTTPREDFKKYFYVFLGLIVLNLLWCVRQYFQMDPIFSMKEWQHQRVFSDRSRTNYSIFLKE